MLSDNLFALPALPADKEWMETLATSEGVRIERIVSSGQASPEGFWYDQAEDEWVALLQGEACIRWEAGGEVVLNPGDWLLIPAHRKHRVARTSVTPPCIWLAVFCRGTGGAD